MASATTTHRRRPTQTNLGRPLRKEQRPAATPTPVAGDKEPWSDEERAAKGLPPIGTGPGAPAQQAERARRNTERQTRFEQEEAEDKAARRRRFVERHVSEVQQGAKTTASSATSGFKGLITGKGGGTIAGTFFGLILVAMGMALLDGGPKELGGWFGAKFVNKPYVAPKAPAKAVPGKGTLVSVVVPASSGSPSSVVTAA
jgi:hypothetical protein